MGSQSRTLFHGSSVSARDARIHSMKNCLSAIIAIASLIERVLPEAHRERGPRLRAAACRLRELLDEDLASPDAVAAPSRLEQARVERLVRSAVERLTDRAERAGVSLIVQCGGGELGGDEEALCEALYNLVANAIDATPERGAVVVATSQTQEGDQHWMIRDTGRGMPADLLAQLGARVASEKEGGTGLGVAVAQEVVARHGGLMQVDSDVGLGTTVSIWLPTTPSRVDWSESRG